jgi:hypothetical protein
MYAYREYRCNARRRAESENRQGAKTAKGRATYVRAARHLRRNLGLLAPWRFA